MVGIANIVVFLYFVAPAKNGPTNADPHFWSFWSRPKGPLQSAPVSSVQLKVLMQSRFPSVFHHQ